MFNNFTYNASIQVMFSDYNAVCRTHTYATGILFACGDR